MSAPVWTPAAAAELDLRLAQLIGWYWPHRKTCEHCLEARDPCPYLGDAIEELLQWRENRLLEVRVELERARELEEARP